MDKQHYQSIFVLRNVAIIDIVKRRPGSKLSSTLRWVQFENAFAIMIAGKRTHEVDLCVTGTEVRGYEHFQILNFAMLFISSLQILNFGAGWTKYTWEHADEPVPEPANGGNSGQGGLDSTSPAPKAKLPPYLVIISYNR